VFTMNSISSLHTIDVLEENRITGRGKRL
jgi:hypothetical protein